MSRIHEAGVRWIQARQERDELEEQRNALSCQHEVPLVDEPVEAGGTMARNTHGRACWKGEHEQVGPEGDTKWVYEREPEAWCDPCRERAELHKRFRAACRRTAALRAVLTRACMAEVRAKEGAPPA